MGGRLTSAGASRMNRSVGQTTSRGNRQGARDQIEAMRRGYA